MIGPDIDHFKDFLRTLQSVEQGLVQGTAYGAGLVPEYPFIGLVRGEFPFELVILKQIVQKLATIAFGYNQQGIFMAGTGNINIIIRYMKRMSYNFV